jgi:hypothetical protein
MCDLELRMEIKELTEDGSFSGIASMYGIEDLGGDIIDRGAFTKTLQESPVVPILWQHKSDEVVGEGALKEWQGKVLINGKLDLDDPTAQKAYQKLKKRLIKGLSIGFQTIKSTWENIEENGASKLIRHIQELKLWEVSIVTFPQLPQAQITRVKAIDADERVTRLEEQFLALSARSSTPASTVVPDPEPREAKEPPAVSIEPELVHSALVRVQLLKAGKQSA